MLALLQEAARPTPNTFTNTFGAFPLRRAGSNCVWCSARPNSQWKIKDLIFNGANINGYLSLGLGDASESGRTLESSLDHK